MYRDEQLASSLAKYLSRYDYAMIDTCSMMEDSFPLWLDILELSKPYQVKPVPVIVLSTALAELKKHEKSKIAEKAIAAKRALKIVKVASKKKTISLVKLKWANQDFLDHAMYVKVSSDRLDSKILVITQDKKFASDLLHLNELQSQFGHKISVDKISPEGSLSPNQGETSSPHRSEKQPHTQPQKAPDIFLMDARVASVINNPNYPMDRKIADVKAQLAMLAKLPKKDARAIKLNYPEERLKDFLARHPSPKADNKPKVAEQPQKETPKKEPPKALPAKKEEPKKLEVKKEIPKLQAPQQPQPKAAPKSEPMKAEPEVKAKPFAASADEVSNRLLDQGIIVRDPGVPYIPPVHGEVDINRKELEGIVNKFNKNGGNTPLNFKNLTISSAEGKLVLSIAKAKSAEPKKEVEAPSKPKAEPEKQAKPAKEKTEKPKASEAPKAQPKADKAQPSKPEAKKETKPEPKKAEAKKTEAKVQEKKEAPKSKKSTKEQPKKDMSAKKEEPKPQLKKQEKPAPKKEAEKKPVSENAKAPKLIVAVPEEKPQPKADSKKAKAEPKKAEAKKQELKTQVKKEAAKPQNKEEPKKAKSSAKEPAKAQPKKSEPKSEMKKKEEAKPEVKPSFDIEKIKLAEARLMAVLPNPTYPHASKLADAEKQLKTVLSLPKQARGELKLSADKLKAQIAKLKEEAK